MFTTRERPLEPSLPYLVIANAGSKRCQAFLDDLTAFWRTRGSEPNATLVSWSEVIRREGNLDDLESFDTPALVRLESPGRDFDVAKQLLALGARITPDESTTDWTALAYRKGRLVRPGLLFTGFAHVLRQLHAAFAARPHLRPLSCPLAIAEMFDKNATCTRLANAGIPCPPWFDPSNLSGPPQLLDELRGRRWFPAYVKLNTGSSASGIAVVHSSASGPFAISSVVRLEGEFYSSRRLARHEGDNLDAVLGFLLREGACVQRGIHMAQIDGQNFDVRVVMIHGRPAFTVFRLSSQPMTNLHLGGRRGEPASCRAAIPTRAWLDALDHCAEAARLYPCDSVGIDLLFESGSLRHYLLEVNAFGDFFPGLVDEKGQTVHAVGIEETARRHGLL